MAKAAYFDCFSGASGDMVIGALLDLGLPIEGLRAALGSLAIEYGGVASERVTRGGVAATRFRVFAEEARDIRRPTPNAQLPAPNSQLPTHHHASEAAHSHANGHHHHDHAQDHHSLTDIKAAIGRSALSACGRARAVALFARLAEIEAAIHDMPVERVHLHEVGALDSIIDIVGAVHGMEWLGADRVMASPLNVGGGTVQCAHGTFPVPAPATARLLEGVPVYAGAVQSELVTPTGALLVTEYAAAYGPLPSMRIDRIGYGAGFKDFPGAPNVLRIITGDEQGSTAAERIVSIECEIDDMNPQLFGPLMDRLAGAGALDVFYAAVQMKKGRPGVLVTAIAAPEHRDAITAVLYTDTTTIGVRYQEMWRDRLDREIRPVATPLGTIRFKVATRDGRVLNASPEFEDCARVAAERGLPIKQVQAVAIKAWIDSRE
ncbi:MAG: TIGR00299 family protein [Acidobacteria bacterium RIFCSPLOWO2_12_FULL_66_21]|nr:MAG: TIGR00299 family protein [Acidobacteria bacterium RIFCSPLOWO2_12_FULL_66_21]